MGYEVRLTRAQLLCIFSFLSFLLLGMQVSLYRQSYRHVCCLILINYQYQ